MDYEQFQRYVSESITQALGKDYKAAIRNVIKNNDMELEGLTIYEEGSVVSPTIYLNEYYEEYEDGRPIGNIIAEIMDVYESHKDRADFDVEGFKDFEGNRDKIVYKLVNAAQNRKLLMDVPYVPLLDLAIVFCYLFESTPEGSATAMIHNSHLQLWDISVEDLYEAALKNTPSMLKYELKNMDEIIKEMLVADVWENRKDESCNREELQKAADDIIGSIQEHAIQMYVLTNKNRLNGAACMLYDGVLHKFACKEGKDLYILPSSIHEVILVPARDDITREELNSMVCEVNSTEVDEVDILSDHVYIYRRETGKICM